MTAPRDFRACFGDIRDAAVKARQFAAGLSFEQFAADEKTAFAVVRCLEIIGEAAGRVPAPIQEKYPELPWREMTGMRHVLIHDYMGVNYGVVWQTVQEDLPPLQALLDRMIAENS